MISDTTDWANSDTALKASGQLSHMAHPAVLSNSSRIHTRTHVTHNVQSYDMSHVSNTKVIRFNAYASERVMPLYIAIAFKASG